MRRLTGWLLLAMLLVGPPVVLVTVVGWPFPDRWPTGSDVRRWLAQPLTEPTMIAVLAVGAWLIWLALVAVVAWQVLGRLRGARRWLRRVRLPTPVQATASGMLGATVFGAPASTSAVPQQPQAPTTTVADHDTQPGVHMGATRATAAERDDAQPQDGRAGGVLLPDGDWIPPDLAEAVAAAATVLWVRRRRAYLPRPPTAGVDPDPALAPMPGAVTAVQSALQDTDVPPSSAVPQPGAGTPVHPHDLPAAGVGLTGPGADAAARGVLVTALMLRRPQPPDPTRVITTRADLTTLLGHHTRSVSDVAGLVVTEDLPAALAAAHGCPAASESPARDDPPTVDAKAPVVLLTSAPSDPDLAGQLTGLLDGAGARRVITVVRGRWSAGVTWEVAVDGTTGQVDAGGRRLCVLSASVAVDLLALHGQAHPVTEPPTPAIYPSPLPPVAASSGVMPSSPVLPDRSAARVARPGLRLWLLGTVAVDHEGVTVPVRRTAALQSLVYLAVHPDGATSHDLAEAIWPHLRPHSTAGRLYTTLSELRRTLHTTCAQQVIDRVQDRYRLNPEHVDVDLWHLRDAVHRATTALSAVDRHQALHAVVSFAGELGAGYTWPWLDGPRHAVRRHLLDAYTTLAAAEADPHRALDLLRDAIGVDPLNEDVHRRALHALAATGDTATIPALLDAYTQRLATAGLPRSDALHSLARRLSPQVPA